MKDNRLRLLEFLIDQDAKEPAGRIDTKYAISKPGVFPLLSDRGISDALDQFKRAGLVETHPETKRGRTMTHYAVSEDGKRYVDLANQYLAQVPETQQEQVKLAWRFSDAIGRNLYDRLKEFGIIVAKKVTVDSLTGAQREVLVFPPRFKSPGRAFTQHPLLKRSKKRPRRRVS